MCGTKMPYYTLRLDSYFQCNRTESLEALFSQILYKPTKLAVIGSGCSVATEPTAEVSHFYNISHVSFEACTHHKLHDGDSTIRTLPI